MVKKFYIPKYYYKWSDLIINGCGLLPFGDSTGFLKVYTNKRKCQRENPKLEIFTMEVKEQGNDG